MEICISCRAGDYIQDGGIRMITFICIFLGLALLLSVLALWGVFENTQSIKAIMKVIEEYEKMFLEVLKGSGPKHD